MRAHSRLPIICLRFGFDKYISRHALSTGHHVQLVIVSTDSVYAGFDALVLPMKRPGWFSWLLWGSRTRGHALGARLRAARSACSKFVWVLDSKNIFPDMPCMKRVYKDK